MLLINLPPFEYKIKRLQDKCFIFDIIRKKYIALTPEEWVRQHIVHYLIKNLGYPPALVSLEKEIKGANNKLHCRPDIVIYEHNALRPWMIVECKSYKEPINTNVLEQIARYNIQLHATLLLVSNGIKSFCWRLDKNSGKYVLLPYIPYFNT